MLLQLLPKHSAESCFIIIVQKDTELLLGKRARKKKNSERVDTLLLKCAPFSSVCSS